MIIETLVRRVPNNVGKPPLDQEETIFGINYIVSQAPFFLIF